MNATAKMMDEAQALGYAVEIKINGESYTWNEDEEPTFYCPRCGMGGADHTDAPFDCVVLQQCDDAKERGQEAASIAQAEADGDRMIREAEDADVARGEDE